VNPDNSNILDQSVQFIKSVGPKRAESFQKIGISTIRDLLFYFPTRYLDRSTLINSTQVFEYVINGYDGEVTVIGRVVDSESRRFGNRQILTVKMRDKAGYFACVWFQGIKYFQKYFKEGDLYAVSGKPVLSKYGEVQFTHPDFDPITNDESQFFYNTGKIIPLYSVKKELKQTNIGDLSLRRIVSYAVEKYYAYLSETLPEDIKKKHKLPDLAPALKSMHLPENEEELNNAKRRFKFEEFFYIEMLVAMKKHNYAVKQTGNAFKIKSDLVSKFIKTLPFVLTEGQLRVLGEIRRDMEADKPMNRLLQGDVGSGKTIVALIAMLIAVDNGFQAVLMAPTEILADQHAKSITKLLSALEGVYSDRIPAVSLLIGGQKKSAKTKNLADIELQQSDIVIGTHALFESSVVFNNLGLVIIDEQHRFGVVQRAKLQSKGNMPDVIVMTATPIPRTLSMTVYGDLDVSTISEMPRNRLPIKTYLRGESKLPEIYKFIVDKLKDGCQTFIVYPLVEESEKLELKAAETYYKTLSETYFSDLHVGLLHGRMTWQEKEEVMFRFSRKKYDILISTTVIEVGIDMPDANIILINDAHRFGLSQLHQLRGRVGRGTMQAHCILVTSDEMAARSSYKNIRLEYLSPMQLEKYKTSIRLHAMVKYLSGFDLAEIDLKLRGPGDIFGIKQSGFPELKYGDIVNDAAELIEAKKEAFSVIESDPNLTSANNKIIRTNLLKHYSQSLNYAKIA
jgi:ATP-dependent DNA helicase RecG